MNKEKLIDLISLNNKTALITGAGAGIGMAMAHRFAESGADLILVDINKGSLESLKKDLSKYNIKVKTYIVDVSKKKAVDGLWKKLLDNFPDILVNNAGIYPFKNFIDINEDHYKKVMDVNLSSVFWMCQNFVKGRGRAGGTVINIGSIEGLLPFKKDLAHYSTSKAGVMALTRALANEHGARGFKINAIIPGGIITEGTKGAAKMVLKFKKGLLNSAMKFKSRLSLGRLGEPDEVARVAIFLASDMSSYMSGSLVVVDGGFLSA